MKYIKTYENLKKLLYESIFKKFIVLRDDEGNLTGTPGDYLQIWEILEYNNREDCFKIIRRYEYTDEELKRITRELPFNFPSTDMKKWINSIVFQTNNLEEAKDDVNTRIDANKYNL